jgi:hypothetical protein
MPNKNKEEIEQQSCNKCRHFEKLESEKPCAVCLKEVRFTRFKPSYEESFIEMVKDKPKVLLALKKVAKEYK